ncbi:hypothetical protein [Taklimakanibacter deserti]|uniref:hypothetical protein n=1 Tax=Taklimakanibacter deserti TaxID=2267839 RepID=UPI0013C41163
MANDAGFVVHFEKIGPCNPGVSLAFLRGLGGLMLYDNGLPGGVGFGFRLGRVDRRLIRRPVLIM